MDTLKFGLCVLIASVLLLSAVDARRKFKRCPKQCRVKPARPNKPKPKPMCGSDGKNYDNWCLVRKAQCEGNDDLKITQPVPCEEKYDCPRVCTEEYKPICGSDGVKYGNECKFRNAKFCDKKYDIRRVGMRKCNGGRKGKREDDV